MFVSVSASKGCLLTSGYSLSFVSRQWVPVWRIWCCYYSDQALLKTEELLCLSNTELKKKHL